MGTFSTDTAAAFCALGERNIRFKLKTTSEAESVSNDPMAIFLTVSLIELIQTPGSSYFQLLPTFFWQMGLGLVLGLLFGKASVLLINQINLDASGLYPVLALSFAALAYGVTSLLHASGLFAGYVMAIIVGNSDLTYRHSIVRFHEGSAWMMQITMFIFCFPVSAFKSYMAGAAAFVPFYACGKAVVFLLRCCL